MVSSILSLPTAVLKLKLSISLRLGRQTLKKQKTGMTPGTLNKSSSNSDLVDTTELGETPLVKKPKLTRPGPEFWPSVPSADAQLLYSGAFPIHWCKAFEVSVLQLTMPFLLHSIGQIYLLYLLRLVISVGGVLQWLSAYLACSGLCI